MEKSDERKEGRRGAARRADTERERKKGVTRRKLHVVQPPPGLPSACVAVGLGVRGRGQCCQPPAHLFSGRRLELLDGRLHADEVVT